MVQIKSRIMQILEQVKKKIIGEPPVVEDSDNLDTILSKITEKKKSLDFTILGRKQGGYIRDAQPVSSTLDVLKKYGLDVSVTDLAILLGADMKNDYFRTSEDDPACPAWLSSWNGDGYVPCISPKGSHGKCRPEARTIGVRPALPPSETKGLAFTDPKTGANGEEIVSYGEYPQTVVDEKTSQELEKAFEEGKLKRTGKEYTFDRTGLREYDKGFRPEFCDEYELNGKKYIRILGRPLDDDARLSSGEIAEKEKPYWVEVQPIEWLKDKSGTWVSKKCLLAGLQFDNRYRYDGDFSKTFIKHYLDTYFAKEMGHDERAAQQNREEILSGLSSQLEKAISDDAVETIKKRLEEAEKNRAVKTTPHRLHEAARIKRLRNARDILNEAAQQAYEAGDRTLLDGIIDLSSTYAARYQGQQNRVAQRRAVRQAQRKQGGRG